MEWALWAYRGQTYNCQLCRNSQKDGFTEIKCPGIEYVDRCPQGKVPKLDDANEEFNLIFEEIEPGLHNGMGGFDYYAIDSVFRRHRLPPGLRNEYFGKCLVMIEAIKEVRREKVEMARMKRTQ